jgi:hypothetical protein
VKGHWLRTCHTPKHLVDVYQASIKEKEREIEMNFTSHSNPIDSPFFLDTLNREGNTYLDISDFFEDFNGKTNLLIGDENMSTTINMFSLCFYHIMFTLSILIVFCYFLLINEIYFIYIWR